MARVVNVSGATVSRVLSGRKDIPISEETRRKVLDAAKKLGYMPNPAARALNNVPTGLIGLWMSLHYSRYRSQVLDEMRSVLGHCGRYSNPLGDRSKLDAPKLRG